MEKKNQEHTVVVLGASHKPERYSNKAVRLLKEHGYRVIPVHPVREEIEGLSVVHQLSEVGDNIHTLTVYVGPERSKTMIDDIVALRPGRVILNPGTESDDLESALSGNKIPYLEACTLVMLQTNQF